MFLQKTRYNPHLYLLREPHNRENLRVELVCTCYSHVFYTNGKKYIELSLKGSRFVDHIRTVIQPVMNAYFRKDELLPEVLLVKVPFRYNKFEITVRSSDGFNTTTEDLTPQTLVRVVLEVSSVYDFWIHWILRQATILKETTA